MVKISEASQNRRAEVEALYASAGYERGINQDDKLIIAEQAERIIGVVRLCFEDEIWMLRGMQILPEHQRQGIGSEMLKHFVSQLNGNECYCIPYTHLENFYSQIGFTRIALENAPPFLTKRLSKYLAEGMGVIIMWRRVL